MLFIFSIALLTACTSGATIGSSSSTPVVSPPETSSPSPSASNVNSVFAGCEPPTLVINWGQSQGAAGTEYRTITFKNTSDKSCEVVNFPSIKLLDSLNGNSLGEVSTHDGLGGLGLPMTLDAGKTLDVSVGTSNPDNYNESDCKAKSASAALLDLEDGKGFTYQLQLPSTDTSWKFCTTKGNTPFFASFELEK